MSKLNGGDNNIKKDVTDSDSIYRLFCNVQTLNGKGNKIINNNNDDDEQEEEKVMKDDEETEWTEYRKKLLQTHGYIIINSVVTDDECDTALQSIWLFINYITFGNVQRDDRNTWSNLWSNNQDDSNYLFESHGAGYILSDINEIIASRLYAKLYNTNELHSSKEGFYFHPPLSLIRQVHDTTMTIAKRTVPLNQLQSRKNSSSDNEDTDKTIIPHIRSFVAFADVIIYLFINDTTNQSNFDTNNQVMVPVPISLRKGHVLLWRTDVIYDYQLEYDSHSTTPTCIMFCTMQPATCTPDDVLSRKIIAYKQRETSTYRLDVEEWICCHNNDDDNYNNGNSIPRLRQFYDVGPPLITMKQAQLYGLVPFDHQSCNDNNIHCNNDDTTPSWTNQQKRALIRGVRFYESDIITSQRMIPYPTIENNTGHLIHLTTTDPNDMIGLEKYLGGMVSPCHQYIYGVPGGAKLVLRIRVHDGDMDMIGPIYEGKFKWLRGVTVSSSTMNHNPKYPNGCCLALPCNSASVLKINPATNDVYTFGEDVLKNCGSDRWHYHGGNVATNNGWLYAIPANANRVAKINPITDEIVYIGPTFNSSGQKWFGGIIGSDGCIYGIPHNETSVLKIDPSNDTVSLLVLDNGQPLPSGQWKWHGGLRAKDKIYGFPNNADNILVIHCRENRVYTIDGGLTLESGRHRIPQDNRYKYLGGATTLDESYAYLFPCDAERVLRVDCITDEVCYVGPHLLDGENKFQNGFVGRDGCIYGIPQRASGVLRITPCSLSRTRSNNVDDASTDDIVEIMDCGPDLIGVKDKFEGGVLGPDGCIYCIPLRSKVCIKVVPGKAIEE
jgi:hypothetical protein